jgi:hypothetical protein
MQFLVVVTFFVLLQWTHCYRFPSSSYSPSNIFQRNTYRIQSTFSTADKDATKSTLKQRIQQDMLGAMKAKDSLRLTTLRSIIASIQQVEKSDQTIVE